ncbi:MAG: DUF167 domain-containing protein [Armatimonadota bacterium]|jgi:uncharacterized protein (TIGR00251 family)
MPAAVNISLKVIPNAPRDEILGWRGGDLAVKITAPPLDGRANDHLRRYLADVFGVSVVDVTLLSGETSRRKTVQIVGISAEQARERLKPHLR